MAKAKLGTGKRFKALKKKLAGRRGKKKVRNPGALAAAIGRKKFGARRFQAMATTGRRRAAGRRDAARALYGRS